MCVYRSLRSEAGFDPDEVQSFLAGGMLVNTMIGLRMTDDYDDPDVRELLAVAFPEKLDLVLELGASHSRDER